MSYILLYYSLLNPFSLVLLFWPTEPCFASHKHLVAVEFGSPTNSSMIFPPASSFIIPITFLGKLLVSNLASRSLLILHTSAEVFTSNLMGKTVSLCEEKFYTISLLLLDLVIVEVIHQFSSLHVDCNKVFLNYHAMLELCFCSELRCFLQVVD